MMLGDAVEQRLRNDPAANTLSAGRIGASRRLPAVPAYVVQVIDDPRPQHFKGFQRVRQSSVQVDAWGKTPAEADALAQAAIDALVPHAVVGPVQFQRATIAALRGGPEIERGSPTPRVQPELHRRSIDFIFMHNAT